MTTGENFAFSYTGTAQKLYKQVLQVLELLLVAADEAALMQMSATSLAIGNTGPGNTFNT